MMAFIVVMRRLETVFPSFIAARELLVNFLVLFEALPLHHQYICTYAHTIASRIVTSSVQTPPLEYLFAY